jgi:hypothetical protein
MNPDYVGDDKPWFVYVKVKDLDGRLLSETEMRGASWSKMGFSASEPYWGPLVRLAPGEARVVRTNVGKFLSDMHGGRLLEGRPGLPWGKRVTLEVVVAVHAFARDATERSRIVTVRTPSILYQLPPERPSP